MRRRRAGRAWRPGAQHARRDHRGDLLLRRLGQRARNAAQQETGAVLHTEPFGGALGGARAGRGARKGVQDMVQHTLVVLLQPHGAEPGEHGGVHLQKRAARGPAAAAARPLPVVCERLEQRGRREHGLRNRHLPGGLLLVLLLARPGRRSAGGERRLGEQRRDEAGERTARAAVGAGRGALDALRHKCDRLARRAQRVVRPQECLEACRGTAHDGPGLVAERVAQRLVQVLGRHARRHAAAQRTFEQLQRMEARKHGT